MVLNTGAGLMGGGGYVRGPPSDMDPFCSPDLLPTGWELLPGIFLVLVQKVSLLENLSVPGKLAHHGTKSATMAPHEIVYLAPQYS